MCLVIDSIHCRIDEKVFQTFSDQIRVIKILGTYLLLNFLFFNRYFFVFIVQQKIKFTLFTNENVFSNILNPYF